uniref:Glucose-methanol-choline oxidoreductase N-terminal domain-containing protein n=1 Tax=Photinus pyralis TaxID=7054 RepID=A0A1Y1N3F8_PHOPY
MDLVNTCPNVLTGTSQQLFVTLLQALFASFCELGANDRYPADYGTKLADGGEFDFIVVGGGSAGSLLANRLTAVSDWRVLLIEAGGYPSILTEIPTMFPHLQLSDEDWKYRTERGSCEGLRDRVCVYPRGKVLGGSSALNAMLYLRSYEDDHEQWVKEGNIGWDYASALKYYNKFEKDVNVSELHSANPIRETIIRGYQEMGFPEKTDTNHLGYSDSLVTIAGGTRQSSAKAFLTTIKDRPNLHLVLKAHVTRLTFSGHRVDGVEVLVNQKVIKLKSRKEVILSAGAMGSPQILMNSGVGPQEHLADLGIPLKKDLPVGEHLQDHPVYIGLFVNINETFLRPKTKEENIDDIFQYVMYRKGHFADAPLFNFHLHANTRDGGKFPDLQVNHIPFPRNSRAGILKWVAGFNFPPEVQELMVENNERHSNLVLFVKCLKSKSTGRIRLNSADPLDYPQIYPNYLSDEHGEDIDILLRGVRLVEELLKTKPLRDADAELVNLHLPKCVEFQFDTDEYWRCALRNYVTHLHHPCGTCRMGPAGDGKSVVGPDLKLHEATGVRVVDASIIPRIPRVNINTVTYFIAEKAAELIIKEWFGGHAEL